MNKYTRGVLFVVLFLSLAQSPSSNVRSPSVRSQQPIDTPANSRIQTIQFSSKLVGKTLPYIAILPVDYDAPSARQTRYPVLYLLHGLGGHYHSWTKNSRLSEYAAKYQIIIVTPEGNDGWYTDSSSTASDKYESYITEELISDVQRRFRAIETREGRAIAGLSMGGYGALKFGVKHPEMFSFVGSMSGTFGAALWDESELKRFEPIWQTLLPVFGAPDNPTRPANDVYKLYGELSPAQIARLPYVYLDCGTGDPLLSASRKMNDLLTTRKIPHEYREAPGAHSWAYWDSQVQEVLRMAAKNLRSAEIDATQVH